jgi:hypothetical protein
MNEQVAKLRTAVGTPVSSPDPQSHGQVLHRCVASWCPLGVQGLENACPSRGVARDAIPDLADTVRVLTSGRSGFGTAAIIYDGFEQDTATINLLRRRRVRSPNLPGVLISEKLCTHDSMRER